MTAESFVQGPELPGESTHTHSLAAVYYALAIGVIGFYGTRVCPFIDSLSTASVVATFGVGFGIAFALKWFFEERLMPEGEPFTLSVYQLIIDFGLFVAVGIGISLFNHWVRGFPLESGAKVLVGCVMFGIFAGLDNGLRRERSTPPSLSDLTTAPETIFPITRRLTVIFLVIVVFTGIVAGLVIIKDIDYLIENINTQSHRFLRIAVLVDVGFVIFTVMMLSIRLMAAYGGNLSYMLSLQIAGLSDIADGKLDTCVPIITRDEFSLIACRTNGMIETLRRANREQRELFEVSLALATELQLDRLLERIVATTRAFVDAERVSLYLHDPARDELWARIAEGTDEAELRFPSGQGIAGYVFTTGDTVSTDDAYADERFNPAFDKVTGFHTRSILCVPIADRDGNTIGVIQALNKSFGEFTDNDAAGLRAFSAQAAVALVNAQLFADLNRMRNYNESILGSLTNGVVTLDSAQRVVKVNRAAMEILEQKESVLGRDFKDLFTEPRDWVDLLLGASQEYHLSDAEISLANGSKRSVNLVSVPLEDVEHHEIGSMVIFEDVTEEERIRSTMSRYLPSQVAEQVLADSENTLGGVNQTATVLFSDIRAFTTISETIGARETVAMLNEYFSAMNESISNHHGILDKYIGDAIMAVFGVPYQSENDANNAVNAALDMLVRLRELNQIRTAQGSEAIDIGIGLSTGDVVAGNVGSARRMDYTVIGDTVNLASRLEAATKSYGVQLMISEHTARALTHDFSMRELDLLRVKGKGEAVALYQVLGEEGLSEAAMQAWKAGREYYLQRRWRKAVECFESVLGEAPGDAPSRVFIRRCAELSQEDLPEDWDGVWVARNKG